MNNVPAPEGFAEFYDDAYSRVVRSVRGLVASMHEAEDLAQDAFARAYTKWETVSQHPEPEAWVKLVALNLGRSRLRRIRVAAKKMATRDHVSDSHEALVQNIDLDRALKLLPPRQRTVLEMHYLEDLSVKEVAQILGASETSVKTNLHRGRTRLSQVMKERADT